ncbi:WD40-repeat-containing domain protein [Cunninghamella echinulata]|nr:WD40-repeat-containing domain protein [Cunninghamella echinulata]
MVYSDPYFLNKFTLDKSLRSDKSKDIGSICWSDSGEVLLSGSRNGLLTIWNPFEGTFLHINSYTGERDNLQSVKFMPMTSDQYAISGSDLGYIRLYDIASNTIISQYSGLKTYTTVDTNNPNDILSCSEDGTVHHFDIRIRHSSLKSSLLLDYNCSGGSMAVHLRSLSIHPNNDHYFATAGSQNYIYLHDRRMISKGGDASFPLKSLIKRFVNNNSSCTTKNNQGLSFANACKFSRSQHNLLMANWSDDGIYLFNINDVGDDNTNVIKHRSYFTGHLNPWVSNENVGFYGMDDEYLISSSDDGLVYIWQRHTRKIVQILQVNASLISAIQGHPQLPILAIVCSGQSIKIYSPLYGSSETLDPITTKTTTTTRHKISDTPISHMFEVDKLIKRNEELRQGDPVNLYHFLIENDLDHAPCYIQ